MKPSRTLTIEGAYMTPAIKYPRRKIGCAEIVDYVMPKGTYQMYGVGGFDYVELKNKVRTTNLKIRRKVWMTDDMPHFHAMHEHAQHYSGHVLVAGLGLGLIVHALAENPHVKWITVIEKEWDVINLIKPLLPQGKLDVIQADFWECDPWLLKHAAAKKKIDGVFYDLFVGNGHDLLPSAMRVWFELHERFPRTVRRIHGFNNEQLQSLDKLIERL